MIKSVIASITLSMAFFSLEAVSAANITAVKAAELACHRLERLVVLKKIDKAFASKFQKLNLEEIPAREGSEAKFAVTSYQIAPHHGPALSLSIFIDATGKVLNHEVNNTGTAGNEVVWSGKDPVSLTEAGLHYVIDSYQSNESLRPFAVDFKSLTLGQKALNGSTVAELVMKSSTTTAKLILTLDMNGKLLNKQVVP